MSGKVVVITGGASGLGFQTARALAAHGGAKVIICDRNAENAQQAMESINGENCKVSDLGSLRP